MRLGIFGGSFNPVHNGHLVLADRCREHLDLDEVWFVPCGRPPHKDPAELADGMRRAEMLELATAGDPRLKVCGIELEREDVSYTVDTLELIHAEDEAHELFLLLGADAVEDLPRWHRPERICELATLVAVNRGEMMSTAPMTGARWEHVVMPAIGYSSSELRDRLRAGLSLRFLLPRAVEVYLTQHDVYSCNR